MIRDVIVYNGVGATGGRNVYGHIPGTYYTFEISDIGASLSGSTDFQFGQAGSGFVYQGDNPVLGAADQLIFSNGTSTQALALDEFGRTISDPEHFRTFGDQSLFLAITPSVSTLSVPSSLLLTDGNGAPKIVVPEAVEDFVVVGDRAYAVSDSGDNIYRIELDGSSQKIYDDFAVQPHPVVGSIFGVRFMFEFNGALWIRGVESTDNDFYRIDPVTNAIQEMNMAQNGGGDNVRSLFVADSQFYFWFPSGTAGSELHVSDGTAAGTRLVEDIAPGANGSFVSSATTFDLGRTIGNRLFFLADDGGADDAELWVSDGTAAGTFNLSGTGTAIGQLGFSGGSMLAFGNQLLFTASGADGSGEELYITDGTQAGTRLVLNIEPRLSPFPTSSSPTLWLVKDGIAYFTIQSGPNDDALWRTDGTAAGTFAVSDPNPGSDIGTPNLVNIFQLDVNPRDDYRDTLFGGPETLGVLTAAQPVRALLEEAGDRDWFAVNLTVGTAVTFDLAGRANGIVPGVSDTFLRLYDASGALVASNDDGPSGLNAQLVFNALASGRYYIEAAAFADIGIGAYEFSMSSQVIDLVLMGTPADNVLRGGAGNDRLVGGAGKDTMIGGNGSDTYIVDSVSDIVVETNGAPAGGVDRIVSTVTRTLGANIEQLILTGANTINATGNELANYLVGNGANNVLTGHGGGDRIIGGAGNDFITGGSGVDVLTGGAGFDNFVFNTASPSLNRDIITDFVAADDTIRLENAVFTALGAATGFLAANKFWASATGVAHDADDRIIYNTATGALSYDADGNAAGGAIQFATLATKPNITAADFLVV